MYTTIFTLATLASYALAAPGQAESETTVTAYKTITSCSGAAPVCTASATEEATAYSTEVSTLISCAPTVSSCPARSKSSIVPIVSQAASVTASASSPSSSTDSTSYVTNLNTVTSCPGGTATTCPTSGVPVTSAPVASASVFVVSSGVPIPSGNGTIVTHATATPSLTVFSTNAGSLLSFNSLLVVVVGILGAVHTL